MLPPRLRLRQHVVLLALASSLVVGCTTSLPSQRIEYPARAVTVYTGQFADAALVDEILIGKELNLQDSHLLTVAYAERFHEYESIPAQWEWELQAGRHFGIQDNWELNGLFLLRWVDVYRTDKLRMTAAIGEGLSWASDTPIIEEASRSNVGATQLLNYLLLEVTFGFVSMPGVDFTFRIHHRSGIFGLFDGVSGGSNVLAVGLRYGF